ncbi:MAG: hypothetical protein FWH01_00590 [Oscillospiraceae bacterium]|nr:hypothetical protein [Oscillospiraceae bacterium]
MSANIITNAGGVFEPDYSHVADAAHNKTPARLPLYEHSICVQAMEKVLGREFGSLASGGYGDKVEFFKNYCEFHRIMGYDTVSYECCIGPAMPYSGLLGGHGESVIHTYEDFKKYPWEGIPEAYFEKFGENFSALREALPAGMKAVGGVGNGIFECAQDITGYMNLAYISADDPELYAELFRKIGDTSLAIWRRFMEAYGDIYCVLRFGDDLGYKSNTLLSASDIRRYIVPEYAKIIACVHEYGKPFLYHSCGCIFDVMPDMIDTARIDAKHSNEDQIAPFPYWVEQYGDRIGNFGGIDTDAVCRLSKPEIREYVAEVLAQCQNARGFAFGSGNSIPDYVPVDNYVEMVNAVRRHRGDFS